MRWVRSKEEHGVGFKRQVFVLDSEIYEPAAAVPFPNSSSRIRERAVEFRSARDTWLRSIMKDDCTLGGMKRCREK